MPTQRPVLEHHVEVVEGQSAAYTQTYTLLANNAAGDFAGFSTLTPPANGVDGNSLLGATPIYVDATDDGVWTNDTWQLDPGSPAINAGDPGSPADPDLTPADMGAFGGADAVWMP